MQFLLFLLGQLQEMASEVLDLLLELLKITRISLNEIILILLINMLSDVQPHMLTRVLDQQLFKDGQLFKRNRLRGVLLAEFEVDINNMED